VNIRKKVKYNFRFIIGLLLLISVINGIIILQIKDNSLFKNQINSIISIQNNMDEILQNLILSKNLATLNKLKQSFVKEEQAFEKIKSKILLSKKVDLLDKILPELIHNKEIVLKVNILFNNEKKVESVFDKSFDIHEKKLLKQIEFDTIYPNENQQRKDIEKFILTTNNFKLSTLVGNMKYYSKETLYQKKDLIRLNDWVKSIGLIYSVSEKNSYEYLETLSLKYKKTVQAIGTLTLDITNLSKQETMLEAKVQKVLKNNRNINQDIENLSRLLSSNFLYLDLYFYCFLVHFEL